MVACTAAGLWVEDDDLGFIGVSRTIFVLGGSRTRSVLGGSGLGGDDLAWVDRAWVAAPIGAISSVFQVAQSRRCWVRRDRAFGAISLLFLSLSLSSIFLWWNSFEGKIQTEMVLQGQRAYFAVNGNDFPFDPIFLAHPNTRIYGKVFPEVI